MSSVEVLAIGQDLKDVINSKICSSVSLSLPPPLSLSLSLSTIFMFVHFKFFFFGFPLSKGAWWPILCCWCWSDCAVVSYMESELPKHQTFLWWAVKYTSSIGWAWVSPKLILTTAPAHGIVVSVCICLALVLMTHVHPKMLVCFGIFMLFMYTSNNC